MDRRAKHKDDSDSRRLERASNYRWRSNPGTCPPVVQIRRTRIVLWEIGSLIILSPHGAEMPISGTRPPADQSGTWGVKSSQRNLQIAPIIDSAVAVPTIFVEKPPKFVGRGRTTPPAIKPISFS